MPENEIPLKQTVVESLKEQLGEEIATTLIQINEGFYEKAKCALTQDWMAHKRQVIDQLSEARISEATKEKRRVSVWQGHAYLSYQERIEIKYAVERECRALFQQRESEIFRTFSDRWYCRLQHYNIPDVLKQFFQYHPWLKTEDIATNSVQYKFLEEYLSKLFSNNHSNWQFHFSQNVYPFLDFRWPHTDKNQLDAHVRDFPEIEITAKRWSLFSNYPSLLSEKDFNDGLNKYRFTQLDLHVLYRCIWQNFKDNSYRQFHKSEFLIIEQEALAHAQVLQAKDCKGLFINLGDLWVLLDIKQSPHKLYIPADRSEDKTMREAIAQIIVHFPNIAICKVITEGSPNASEVDDSIVRWQYHLLARVLPFTQQELVQDINDYRSNLPLDLLIGEIWQKSVAKINSWKDIILNRERKHHLFNFLSLETARPFSGQYWYQQIQPDYFSFYDIETVWKSITEKLDADSLLKSIDQNCIKISPVKAKQEAYQLSFDAKAEYFLQACFIACYAGPSQIKVHIPGNDETLDAAIPQHMFNRAIRNVTFVEFEQKDNSVSNYPALIRIHQAAACNRLLEAYHRLPIARLSIEDEERAHKAVEIYLALLKKNQALITRKFIADYIAQVQDWKKVQFDPLRAENQKSLHWQLAQFAHMGMLGMETLFEVLEQNYLQKWDAIEQTPELKFPLILDLNSDGFTRPADFIRCLNSQFQLLMDDKRGKPKLAKIHLLLARNNNAATIEALSDLIKIMNEAKYRDFDEVEEICFYDFLSLDEKQQNRFLTALEALSKQRHQPLIAMIKLPELEGDSKSHKLAPLKNAYRALQNKILDNQRCLKQKTLAEDTEILNQAIAGRLDPMVDIRSYKHHQEQPFPSEDRILLTASAPGIQQELQQNVEARHEIVAQKEKKRLTFKEDDFRISAYPGSTKDLLSRNNIAPKFRKDFDRWVGTEKSIRFSIQLIEPEALEQILAKPALFKMGLEHQHLPFGFSLSYMPQNEDGYILCYDEKKAKRQQHDWQQQVKECRNPFIPQQATAAPILPFDGDQRQFHWLVETEEDQHCHWRHFALKKEALRTYEEESFPAEAAKIQDRLGLWAEKTLGEDNNAAFIKCFISLLDDEGLRALGQLGYQYNSEAEAMGSSTFLRLNHSIYQNFGEAYYRQWFEAVVRPCENYADIIRKQELDAVSLSLITLKDKSPAFSQIWFALLEAQQTQAGIVHYAELWYAYQCLISFIDQKQLHLDGPGISDWIQKQSPFHALLWIDRVYQCLKFTDGQLYDFKIQQDLLDNITHIDWHFDGLLYAMRHNEFTYWAEDLELSNFKIAEVETGYMPQWTERLAAEPELRITVFSRFLAARVKLNYKQYLHYQQELKPLLEEKAITGPLISLLLIQLSSGVELISDLKAETCAEIIKKLQTKSLAPVIKLLTEYIDVNSLEHQAGYSVKFEQLPILLQAMSCVRLSSLEKLSENELLALLNALAKNHQYLQHMTPYSEEAIIACLSKNLQYALQDLSFIHPMGETPWLIADDEKQTAFSEFSQDEKINRLQSELLAQLGSIDYARSSQLPSAEDINKALAELEKNPSENQRRDIISEWVGNGCYIVRQDANFRHLNSKEQDALKIQMRDQLLPQHQSENERLLDTLLPLFTIEANHPNPQQLLTELISQLKRIDNKPHFNDLALVFGCVLQQAEDNKKVSLQQLCELIDCLSHQDYDEKKHFPSDVLKEAIQQAGEALCSEDGNRLSPTVNSRLKERITAIISADIAQPLRPGLLRITKTRNRNIAQKWIDHFAQLQTKGIALDYQMHLIEVLEKAGDDALLHLPENINKDSLWLRTRHLLLKSLLEHPNEALLEELKPFLVGPDQKNEDIEIIAVHSLIRNKKALDLHAFKQILQDTHPQELKKLATYCAHPPYPSPDYLMAQLSNGRSVHELIDNFERVSQAQGLRHFSVTEEDRIQLLRVLNGIKEKGRGYVSDKMQKTLMGHLYYINAFSQAAKLDTISSEALKERIRQSAIWLHNCKEESQQQSYRLQLLAMLRELLLRQTGKWANHTQMLALIYASMHPDESLFSQLKTGQGKSIITIMQVAFQALSNKVVDVYTAKESLSSRDHEEFGYILDAIGIQCNHLTANDDEDQYQVGDEVFGAINYLTPGGFSLFQSDHCWSVDSKRYINYHSKDRVAYFDEGDHVLLDEQTMFNFSYGGDTGTLYNYDAWVYQTTWKYFQSIKEQLPRNEKGLPYLVPNVHLKALCEALQEKAELAPVQSDFVKNYLAPVVDDSVKDKQAAMHNRDKMLAALLSAAYTASNLVKDSDYCIQPTKTPLSDGMMIVTRQAKVVIQNQVQSGASYSERVHQFLHVRLNEEALEKGEVPDFFIAPDSAIVLSQNVPTVIKNYYSQSGGCSATMGDAGDLAAYEGRYGLNHVLKIPTHEPKQTAYQGMIFCDSEESYLANIRTVIANHRKQPILLVSEDDIAVKALSHQLRNSLPPELAENFISDTNDSGLKEKDILPKAGKAGVIVNSARMARGTDIRPETELGLLVIRAAPQLPRFAKQSGGRQGRNGAKGVLIDIVDYSKITREFQHYLDESPHAERLKALMIREEKHLQRKLAKHEKMGSHQWDWLKASPDNQEKYLKTRALQYLKHEIKIYKEQYIRAKETLVSECSSHMISQLMHHIGEDQKKMQVLREQWRFCREAIDFAWAERLKNATEDNDEVFNQFYQQAEGIWQSFAKAFPEYLDSELLADKNRLLSPVKSMLKIAWEADAESQQDAEPTQKQDMPLVIAFYQHWLAKIGQIISARDEARQQVFYGRAEQGINALDSFHQAVMKMSQQEGADAEVSSIALFVTLATLPVEALANVPLRAMTEIIHGLNRQRQTENFDEKLQIFEQVFYHPMLSDADASKRKIKVLGEMTVFLTHLCTEAYIDEKQADFCRFNSKQTCDHLQTYFNQQMDQLKPGDFKNFETFIHRHPEVARLFSTRLSASQWQKLLSSLRRYDSKEANDCLYLEQVADYFQQNLTALNGDYAETLDALFDIFFHYPERRIDLEQFIRIDQIQDCGSEQNIQLLYFIAEQTMISEEQIKQITDMIQHAFSQQKALDEKYLSEIIPKLSALPANLPWDMIEKRVAYICDHQTPQGFVNGMKMLIELGSAFNAFTNQKGISHPESSLVAEANLALLARAQKLILAYEQEGILQEAVNLFTCLSKAKYSFINANVSLTLAEKYRENYQDILKNLVQARDKMEAEVFADYFSWIIDNYNDENAKILSYFKTSNKRLSSDSGMRKTQQQWLLDGYKQKQAQQIHSSLNLVETAGLDFNDRRVWAVMENHQNDFKTFEERITLIKQINRLDSELRESVYTEFDRAQNFERLKTFLDLAEKEKDLDLGHLFNRGYSTQEDWQSLIDSQKLAKHLGKVNNQNHALFQRDQQVNYDSLFSKFEENGADRLNLMHCIYHELIEISEAVRENCWTSYQNLVKNTLKEAKGLQARCRSIRGFAEEMVGIAKPPQAQTAIGNKTATYLQYINGHKANYLSFSNFFTTNGTRRAQARTLFSALEGSCNEMNKNKQTFYQEVLATIDNTQRDIIEQDGNLNITNSKGHSRLLNISQDLALIFCQDALMDETLSQETHGEIQTFLNAQRDMAINQLYQRLPRNHCLITDIEPYVNSVEKAQAVAALNQCKRAIMKTSANELPEELRYLLPLIQGHFALEENKAAAQTQAVHGGK